MSGDKNEEGRGKTGNIISISSRYDKNQSGDETSLDELVIHMRRLRESIPVNQNLRKELKARLLIGHQSPKTPEPPTLSESKSSHRWNLWWGAGAVVAVLLLLVIIKGLNISGEKVIESGPVTEVGRFWAEDSPLAPAVSPLGGIMVVERGGALLILDRQGAQFTAVSPLPGIKYSSPAWSPDGSKLALVRQGSSGTEIVAFDLPGGGKPRDIQKAFDETDRAVVMTRLKEGDVVANLSWSPQGKKLSFAVLNGDRKGLYIGPGDNPVYAGPGVRAAWSPDGNWLAVEREDKGENTIWVVERDSGKSYLLAQGSFPLWSSNGFLIFMQTAVKERILSYLPDGTPQFKVQKKTGEIRSVYMGSGKNMKKLVASEEAGVPDSKLLFAPDTPTGSEEMKWIKNLELKGVRDPMTLYLDRSGEHEGLVLGDDSLILSRKEGDVVILNRIGFSVNPLYGGAAR